MNRPEQETQQTATPAPTEKAGNGQPGGQAVMVPPGAQSVVRVHLDDEVGPVAATLGLPQAKGVIVVIGAAASLALELTAPELDRLQQLFNIGLLPAALEQDAIVVDGGTRAGVMEMVGIAAADRTKPATLVGVLPEGAAVAAEGDKGEDDDGILDPNHSHFLLVQADEWGEETPVLFRFVQALSRAGADGRPLPVVVVLAGGRPGRIAEKEALFAVRYGWPLVVIEGTGSLPEAIAAHFHRRHQWAARQQSRFGRTLNRLERPFRSRDGVLSPALAEIVAGGSLHFFHLNDDPAVLRRLLVGLLPPTRRRGLLDLAWERFALYDSNAIRQQNSFRVLRNWPLVLGVLTAALAIIYTAVLGIAPQFGDTVPEILFRFVIIVLPILTSVLLAIETEFKAGSKWFLLRGAAETVKGEIYRYRVMTYLAQREEDEAQQEKVLKRARARLSRQLGQITDGVMNTEASESALLAYEGKLPPPMYSAAATDDGFSPMPADHYLAIRIGDQLNFFRSKTAQLDRQLRTYQIFILLFGGAGSLLAAVGAELWIPLTTTIVTAITSYLGYYQVKETLKQYNQVENNLNNVRSWWRSLFEDQREDAEKIKQLVKDTEEILRTENIAWVQKMQEAYLRDRMDTPGGAPTDAEPAADSEADTGAPTNGASPDRPAAAGAEEPEGMAAADGNSGATAVTTPVVAPVEETEGNSTDNAVTTLEPATIASEEKTEDAAGKDEGAVTNHAGET